MLFNDALKKIIESLPEDISIVSHDWYLYLICSAFEGVNIYDAKPQILYRQHANNLVGSNLGFLSRLNRLTSLYNGEFAKWNRLNKQSLDFFYNKLSEKNKTIINSFYECQNNSLVARIKGFRKSGVYRMSKVETLTFTMINMLGRLF